jgi:hypothetical protein
MNLTGTIIKSVSMKFPNKPDGKYPLLLLKFFIAPVTNEAINRHAGQGGR